MLISIVGNNKTGKTTVCDGLSRLFNKVYVLSFADALRDEIHELYGIPKEIFTYKGGDDVPLMIQEALNGRHTSDYKDVVKVNLKDLSTHESVKRDWKSCGILKRYNKPFNKITVTLRELLIIHGTDIRRHQDSL